MAALAAVANLTAKDVAKSFVMRYYYFLRKAPWESYHFYDDISKLGRPEKDGSLSMTTTRDGIKAKLVSLNYQDYKFEIISIDAQESLNGGINILVIGNMTGKDNIQQCFTHSLFLAPQKDGYFLLNDMFRYVAAPTISKQVPEIVLVAENNIPEQLTEESRAEKLVLEDAGQSHDSPEVYDVFSDLEEHPGGDVVFIEDIGEEFPYVFEHAVGWDTPYIPLTEVLLKKTQSYVPKKLLDLSKKYWRFR